MSNTGYILQDVATVPVKSGWLSKINWLQLIGPALSLLVMTNPADVLAFFSVNPDPALKAVLILVIQTLQAAVTWVLRTYFNGTVNSASLRQ